MTILGISVGTIRTGVCILQDQELLERNLHGYHCMWSDLKMRVILNRYKRYIVKYRVTGIIVKVPPPRQITKPVSALLKRLAAMAEKYGCKFDLITKNELMAVTGARSTNELISYTTLRFPELSAMFDRGTANNHAYYKKVYEAIISAYLFQDRLQQNATRKTE